MVFSSGYILKGYQDLDVQKDPFKLQLKLANKIISIPHMLRRSNICSSFYHPLSRMSCPMSSASINLCEIHTKKSLQLKVKPRETSFRGKGSMDCGRICFIFTSNQYVQTVHQHNQLILLSPLNEVDCSS